MCTQTAVLVNARVSYLLKLDGKVREIEHGIVLRIGVCSVPIRS